MIGALHRSEITTTQQTTRHTTPTITVRTVTNIAPILKPTASVILSRRTNSAAQMLPDYGSRDRRSGTARNTGFEKLRFRV
jgi:hypothetical protein